MSPDHAVASVNLLHAFGILLFINTLGNGLNLALASDHNSGSESRAGQIMQQVYDNSVGENRVSREILTLVQPGQRPRTRHLNLFRKVDENEVRTLIRFTDPASIRRTGVLSIERQDGSADQWIFLPAAQAVRRIAGARKGDRFAGSDFFYEDILLRMAASEENRWLSSEFLEDEPVDVIESKPSGMQSSAYSKKILWISTKKNIPLRIDFFQGSETAPFKRFEVLDIAHESGKYTVSESVMHDLGTGHSTYLQSQSVERELELPDHLFTTHALKDGYFEGEFAPSR